MGSPPSGAHISGAVYLFDLVPPTRRCLALVLSLEDIILFNLKGGHEVAVAEPLGLLQLHTYTWSYPPANRHFPKCDPQVRKGREEETRGGLEHGRMLVAMRDVVTRGPAGADGEFVFSDPDLGRGFISEKCPPPPHPPLYLQTPQR